MAKALIVSTISRCSSTDVFTASCVCDALCIFAKKNRVSAPPAQNPQAPGDILVASQGDACVQVICSFCDLGDGATAQPFQLVV